MSPHEHTGVGILEPPAAPWDVEQRNARIIIDSITMRPPQYERKRGRGGPAERARSGQARGTP